MSITTKYNNIYPISNYLTFKQLKWELEDYCFYYLHPIEYKRISKLLNGHHIDRERYIKEFVYKLQKSINKEGIKVNIYGRPKHIYSIWRKMQKKYLTFDKVFDVLAVRVIAEHKRDCYTTLNIVHTNFQYLPNEFDDYIINPKSNGYQSIHTVILGPNNKMIEIQIRSKQMHENAELGVAAHWKYKANNYDNISYQILKSYNLIMRNTYVII